jgi:uncharacterized protein (DUF2141 family)
MNRTTSVHPTLVTVAAALLCLAASAALAQSTTGTLTGRVTYEEAPLPGVTVTLDSPALQGQSTAIANTSGGFVFRGLPPGSYTVTFVLEGFTTLEYPARLPLHRPVDGRRQLDVVAHTRQLQR